MERVLCPLWATVKMVFTHCGQFILRVQTRRESRAYGLARQILLWKGDVDSPLPRLWRRV